MIISFFNENIIGQAKTQHVITEHHKSSILEKKMLTINNIIHFHKTLQDWTKKK